MMMMLDVDEEVIVVRWMADDSRIGGWLKGRGWGFAALSELVSAGGSFFLLQYSFSSKCRRLNLMVAAVGR